MNNVQYSDPMLNMQPQKQGGILGLPTWAVILILLFVCVCLGAVCVFCVLPVIFGEAIGNVFSNIISTLEATTSP
jgi:hypothetical protein